MARKARAKKETRDIASIINNTSDRAKLKAFIDQSVGYFGKIEIIQQDIKAVREDAVETLNIDPKLFSNLVRVFRANGFEKTLEEMSELEIALEMLGEQSNTSQE